MIAIAGGGEVEPRRMLNDEEKQQGI